MEDELERNRTTLFKINDKNDTTEILYLYIPKNEKIENYIVTHNCELLTNLAKGKNGRIIFFKKDTLGLYKFYNK